MKTNFDIAHDKIALEKRSHPVPVRLEGLRQLAYNLYWAWHDDVRELFRRINPGVWTETRNPVAVLEQTSDYSHVLEDPSFLTGYQAAYEKFVRYIKEGQPDAEASWFGLRDSNYKDAFRKPAAYFCAEFGLTESLPIYSGGLGILAGDHLKATSDSGVPLVAVGLFYRQGYFRQTIDADGHQEHAYPRLEPRHLPMQRMLDPQSGRPLLVEVPIGGETVSVGAWLVRVGRVPLILLDTDLAENPAAFRPITAQLYVRGRDMRLYQEIVLGAGGVKVLRTLGIDPSVWHLNEGHSAMLLVERMRELMHAGKSFEEAREQVVDDSVFTIHTPVPAGNERFDANLARRLAGGLVGGKVDFDRIIELGRSDAGDGVFDMTAFCLRNTKMHNGVSQLHGETAKNTWEGVSRRPIFGLTNGVHMPTWLGRPLQMAFEEHGADLDDMNGPGANRIWEKMDEVSDEKLWKAHLRQKSALAFFARGRLRSQLSRHGQPPEVLNALQDALDPNILTLGFARRFATYKRAALLFRDEDRLARLMWNEERPVQILFAGKAHPADRPGQGVIQRIFEMSRSERFKGRVFILEDYDMRIGRFMTQGVDVWLNNPRRPLEASGTSGMKAAANGIPNCSILDGWWDEGFENDNGWAIGGRDMSGNDDEQDHRDSEALYHVLEDMIVPEYYQRDGKLPTAWIARMRRSIASSLWQFSTTRMVQEYTDRMYEPASSR